MKIQVYYKLTILTYFTVYTLKLFLSDINDFHYSNSEKLGDGFEYLLSILGTQGDAGQFRTPRHIIDFITEVSETETWVVSVSVLRLQTTPLKTESQSQCLRPQIEPQYQSHRL